MHAEESLASLVDRYLLVTADLRHFEEERERLRDAILAAAGSEPREIPGSGGAVRVGTHKSCRFDSPSVVSALDAARLLSPIATVNALRLRRAVDEDPAVERAIAHLVVRVDSPTLSAVPAKLRWTPASQFVERLRAKAMAHE